MARTRPGVPAPPGRTGGVVRLRRLALATATIALCGLALWEIVEWPSLPPLAADLSGPDWDAASAEFGRRIVAKFPTGSPERILILDLEREGFNRRGPTLTFPNGVARGYGNSYELLRSGFPCRRVWGVYWNSDSEGRVGRIIGRYGRVCL